MKRFNKSYELSVFLMLFVLVIDGIRGDETRAEQPAVDDTVKVHRAPRVREPGIKGCLSRVSSYNVRLQSLKTSGGSVYARQLVTTADLPCFEKIGTKATLNATAIDKCAEATAKKGLNSFSWENGVCTAYLAWRPQKRADCKDGGSKVVYVVKKPLTPFEGGNIVSGELNFGALPQVFLNISQYNFCGSSSIIHKGYKLLINGSDVVMLPEGQTTYSLNLKIKCSTSVNFSLWSVGADGKVNSYESQVTYTGGSPSGYYGLESGGCIYDADRKDNYSDSLQYCNSKANGTLYFEEVDGGALAFLSAVFHITSDPEHFTGAFVGLTWAKATNWTWLGGRPQPSDDVALWLSPPPTGTRCAVIYMSPPTIWRLLPRFDCGEKAPVVCYYPNP